MWCQGDDMHGDYTWLKDNTVTKCFKKCEPKIERLGNIGPKAKKLLQLGYLIWHLPPCHKIKKL